MNAIGVLPPGDQLVILVEDLLFSCAVLLSILSGKINGSGQPKPPK